MEIPEIDLSKVKHRKGKPLTVEEAKSVVKVFHFLVELFNKQERGEILRLRIRGFVKCTRRTVIAVY